MGLRLNEQQQRLAMFDGFAGAAKRHEDAQTLGLRASYVALAQRDRVPQMECQPDLQQSHAPQIATVAHRVAQSFGITGSARRSAASVDTRIRAT